MNSRLASSLSGITLLIVASALAGRADTISATDKVFFGKVSQGGMYEVELGKLAQTKGQAQDIRDSGNTEAHDHMLVGNKLKAIIEANGLTFPTSLNAEFEARLDRITALPADQFDMAYIKDMKKFIRRTGPLSPRKPKRAPIPI